MLEIGIGTMIPGVHSSMVGYALDGYKPGGSLRAWRDYFPTAWIFGADVQSDTQFTGEDRIETLLMDSTNLNECERVLSYHVFNIIIDDGSHLDTSQLLTLRNLWKRVRPNGYYIIEDVFPGSRITTDFLSDIQAIIGPDASYFFSEKKNLMIIYKHNLS
jgi:8-demethyl-8-alpha-L-rhamnosyltetracenomycin-C 2'-O-methyltransferase